ncbi:hypothetical protein B0T18DRAFT_430742 [Schizothecium vesticola]|uniref:Clr5 domain-containing protein n=1 Tax=Schizothecium vesticola TaxID=314040 RepID=A0AA40EQ83_9PEZI|nr:hypothetical protein B0T18DRAFT_430742 [Schizothecium vesticola]
MSTSPESAGSNGLPAKARKWASDDSFTRHRKSITELYSTMTLPNLLQTMEREHNFFATPKMYKTRFRRWGLWKHNQASTVVEIVRLQRERDAAHKPTTEILLHGQRVDLARVDAYLRRNDKMRRYVSSLPTSAPHRHPPTAALICRTPSPSPSPSPEESLYRAIRTYYASSLSTPSRTWVFDPPTSPSPAHTSTTHHLHLAQTLWLRFRTALNHLVRPPLNLALAARLLRIVFAELTTALLSPFASPLLPFWILHVVVLLREAHPALPPEFRPLEAQLLRHVADLTAAARTPGWEMWRVLCRSSAARERWHVRRCAEVAGAEVAAALGGTHAVAVDLGLAGVLAGTGTGAEDAGEKSRRYAALWETLSGGEQGEGEFDGRHMDVLACWAVHLRQHRRYEEAEELILREVLRRPERMAKLHACLGSAFNLHIMLATVNIDMERYPAAEGYCRKALVIAKMQVEATSDDGDLFEGLDTLETCLRAQDKHEEADGVVLERETVVKQTLEKVGEKEDSV